MGTPRYVLLDLARRREPAFALASNSVKFLPSPCVAVLGQAGGVLLLPPRPPIGFNEPHVVGVRQVDRGLAHGGIKA